MSASVPPHSQPGQPSSSSSLPLTPTRKAKAAWNAGRDAEIFASLQALKADGELGNANIPKLSGCSTVPKALNEKFLTSYTAQQVQSRIRNLHRDYTFNLRALAQSGSSDISETTWLVKDGKTDFWEKMRGVQCLYFAHFFFAI
jgi:hypothetical protein